MMRLLIELAMAFLGTLGFGMIFHVRRKHILWVSIGGLVTWMIYRVGEHYLDGLFFPTLIAAVFSSIYSESMARIRKVPVTLFLISSVIPLIPGGSLYYTLSYAVQKEWTQAEYYGYNTAVYAIGIAVGISMVAAFWKMGQSVLSSLEKKNE